MAKKKTEIKYKCCYNCQHRMLVSGTEAHKFNKIDCICSEKWDLPVRRNIFRKRWCTGFIPIEDNDKRVSKQEADEMYNDFMKEAT